MINKRILKKCFIYIFIFVLVNCSSELSLESEILEEGNLFNHKNLTVNYSPRASGNKKYNYAEEFSLTIKTDLDDIKRIQFKSGKKISKSYILKHDSSGLVKFGQYPYINYEIAKVGDEFYRWSSDFNLNKPFLIKSITDTVLILKTKRVKGKIFFLYFKNSDPFAPKELFRKELWLENNCLYGFDIISEKLNFKFSYYISKII